MNPHLDNLLNSDLLNSDLFNSDLLNSDLDDFPDDQFDDHLYGGKTKRKRKMKTKMKVFIHKDRYGRYIIINGKKYRIGSKVKNSQVAKFAIKKAKSEPIFRRNASDDFIAQEVAQRVDIEKEKLKREYENNRKLKSNAMRVLGPLTRSLSSANNMQSANIQANTILQKQREREEELDRDRSSRVRQELERNSRKVKQMERLYSDLNSISNIQTLKQIANDIILNDSNVKGRIPGTKSALVDFIIENAPIDYKVPLTTRPPSPIIRFLDENGNEEHKDDSEAISSDFEERKLDRQKLEDSYMEYYPDITRKKLDKLTDADLLEGLTDMAFSGTGKIIHDLGLSNFDIDKIMSPYSEYLGTISHDRVRDEILPNVKAKSRGGFVINTDPLSKPGEHWQSVFFDARPEGSHSIEFFDSYGDPIDKSLQKDLMLIANRLNAGTYLKLKENRIKYQNDKSSNCGWFASKFLIDRFRNRPFSEASGYDDTKRGEANIERFKHQRGFGYIPSFQNGGIGFPVLRSDYPPAVRKYLVDTPISSITVCRKPISSRLDNLINAVSLGGWNVAKQKIGIDKALHLYMVLNGDTILERNHVISMRPGKTEQGAECMNIPVTKNITFKELLENTKSAVGGPELNRYDARDNNCQVFLSQVLKANGLLTPEADGFINQDIKGVFEHLPWFTKRLAGLVTDTAHRVDTVINGSKLDKHMMNKHIVIKESSDGPPISKHKNVQSIIFEKELWTPFRAEKWITDHGFSTDYGMDEKHNTLRFRQFNPIEPGRFRTLSRTLPEGIKFVLEY